MNEPFAIMEITVIDAVFTGVKRNVNDVLNVITSHFHALSGHKVVAVKNKRFSENFLKKFKTWVCYKNYSTWCLELMGGRKVSSTVDC